jgi:hypothetical protein
VRPFFNEYKRRTYFARIVHANTKNAAPDSAHWKVDLFVNAKLVVTTKPLCSIDQNDLVTPLPQNCVPQCSKSLARPHTRGGGCWRGRQIPGPSQIDRPMLLRNPHVPLALWEGADF